MVQLFHTTYNSVDLANHKIFHEGGINNYTVCIKITWCNLSARSTPRLPNARMLNILLNIKNNCSVKKIKNRGMSCNSLWIPAFVV